MQRVVIVGGGFAGLTAAKRLRRAPVEVVLIDRTNHHLFQPLLYQVATGGLSPADIAAPIRWILRRQQNATVMLAEVERFDLDHRRVHTSKGPVAYDSLIVAAGATHHYFGNDDWAEFAPGLKSLADATEIRKRILHAFEHAEVAREVEERRAWLTFAIVGAGPTGAELAGAIGELARDTLRSDFRNIDTAEAHVVLIEGTDQVLGTFPEPLPDKARRSLERLGVSIRTDSLASHIDDNGVTVGGERIEARTVIWAAGVQASPLGRLVAPDHLDRVGRVMVTDALTVPERPEVFVVGDLAHIEQDGSLVPGVAPAALQQGRHAADVIAARLGGGSTEPFRYRNKGNLATLGRSAAVAELGRFRFSGFVAWLLWLFVHIMYLVGFENRLLVLTQWAWNYVTRNRSARLIVDHNLSER